MGRDLELSVIDLNIIGQIQQHGRIRTNCSNMVVEKRYTWWDQIYRTLTGEGREKNVSTVEARVDNALSIAENHVNSRVLLHGSLEEKRQCIDDLYQLAKAFESAKRGLTNLKSTYNGDAQIQARLQWLITKCDRSSEQITQRCAAIQDTIGEQSIGGYGHMWRHTSETLAVPPLGGQSLVPASGPIPIPKKKSQE